MFQRLADELPVLIPLLAAAGSGLLRIVAILLLTYLARAVAFRVIRTAMTGRTHLDERRLKTLETLVMSVARYSIGLAAIIAILGVLGIDTTSILAGAGIIGLAVGFGAQNLVRDIITGFFLVFEDQFSVGEFVTIGGQSGLVEEMGLRVTKLRAFAGEVHVIPNSNIAVTTNHSRGDMRAMVDVSVAYEEDVERVTQILNQTLAGVKEANPSIRDGPTVLGVFSFGPSEMVFRIVARTEPMAQWALEREIRRAVKLAFDREGIEIPYPRLVQVPASATKIGREVR
ncbi:MAG TPA: mechanosensitive ion channel protein MscS [Clostridiales bacterium UBA8153]|nr:mechanosensitive ion channel protein MscS [Clostridiales bacterium UBA8153]